MKKLFSIAACITLLGFVSCGSKSEASGQDSDTLATTDVTTQQPEVVAEEPEENPNDPQVIFDVLSKKLQGGDEVMYFTYDITGDGLPELFVYSGSIEAEKELNVYTYEEGKAKKIYEAAAGHTGYFQGRGYIIAYWSHMGGFEVSKLTYQNGKIVSKTITSGEPMDDEDEEICYPEVDEPMVDFVDGRNTSALRKALGVSVSKEKVAPVADEIIVSFLKSVIKGNGNMMSDSWVKKHCTPAVKKSLLSDGYFGDPDDSYGFWILDGGGRDGARPRLKNITFDGTYYYANFIPAAEDEDWATGMRVVRYEVNLVNGVPVIGSYEWIKDFDDK